MEGLSYSIEQYLSLLIPYFSETSTVNEDTATIGNFLAAMMPVDSVTLVRLDNEHYTVGSWHALGDGAAAQSAARKLILDGGAGLLALMDDDGVSEGDALDSLMELEAGMHAIAYTFFFNGRPCGFLVVCRKGGGWNAPDRRLFATLRELMSAAFAMHISIENENRSSFVLNTVMDGMKSSIYITDVNTDRILFMNQAMKEDFGVEEPEGKVCYQVLQRGMTHRCGFCPVDRLLRGGESTPVIQWDELNTVTGRSYRNYDSLIRWMDGSTVHLQQSVDVTELNTANTDELTQLLSRRPGKIALQDTLDRAKQKGRSVTVCFYDINNLKEVNDQFGHAQGDQLITSVAWAVRDILRDGEYAFRMSGDEFVVVFLTEQQDAHLRLTEAQKKLRKADEQYAAGFCYGLVDVPPDSGINAEDALMLADERMYEQKRRYHIMRNEQRLLRTAPNLTSDVGQYGKNLLYSALSRSTNDYPFICDMKTGVFRYAPAMVEEFDLPGEVIENAAAVWGERVHESDRAAFLEANQDITDGRALSHCVAYRAKDRRGEWVWVRCRGHVELDENNEPALFAGFISNLNRQGRIDPLTGLFSRLEFEERARECIDSRPDVPFGVIVWGIDGLKRINDLYGRAAGDEAVRLAARKLQELLPSGTTFCRLDGDTFGVIVPNADGEKLQTLGDTVIRGFDCQPECPEGRYRCTVSGGSAAYPGDAKSFDDLLRRAEECLDAAKRQGKNRCVACSPDVPDRLKK